ncbi:MAG TPA: S9 family peptidase [Steroidobacteraceae bacterium]|jgi:dipeptidyl aminopeptidase/acylaminoacyl peptidase
MSVHRLSIAHCGRASWTAAFLFAVLAVGLGTLAAATPLTVEDLVRLKRLSDPQVSPDGHYVAYVVRETDMEANKGRTDVWLLDLRTKNAQPHRLTQNPANDSNPRWAADSRTIYFLSTRSGSSQVWRLSLDGGEAAQVTSYPLDVGTLKVSPMGDRIAFSMEVLPSCADLQCTKEALAQQAKGPATGRLYDRLFIRHWDTWGNGTRSHLFAATIGADGKAGKEVDVSKPLDGDVPSKPFGGDEEYTFSPDGRSVVFSLRVAGKSEPWSTNFDLFQTPSDGSAAPRDLTADNPAWDTQPVFLKNGDLAWLAQDRPGFESDRFHVVIRNARTGAARELTRAWDRSVARLGVTPDGRKLLATADDRGQKPLFWIDPASGAPHKLVGSGEVGDYSVTNDSVVYALASQMAPDDLYSVSLNGGASQKLTQVNQDVLGARQLSEFESFDFKGWNDESVQGYVMKPYGYEAGKRYPIAFVVHGGPQSAFGNLWTYRWNAQAFAGAGYAVVMIDFHGSPGYGQAFTDSISRDWGGKPLEDLQKGLAAAIGKYSWLDGNRACALGASYGGFMMNWIEGNWPDRFKCIVDHDGVFDQRMMGYSTEELWFSEWENGGTPYEHPDGYEKSNPVDFVSRWKTPMLVIHGEQDFRIPYDQGIASFTALQRKGIESRLLIFPDENHWVLKPANSVLWYHTVLDWLNQHLKP